MTIAKATLQDIPSMQSLVYKEIESGIILERSDEEIATNIRSYILVKQETKIIGFCALHIHTSSLGEIRSLVVHEQFRRQGVAKTLINASIEEARALGIQRVLALTYAATIFTNLAFVEMPKEALPEHKIWADCIKCKHFPVCNEVALIYTISYN